MPVNKRMCKARRLIERAFNRLKDFSVTSCDRRHASTWPSPWLLASIARQRISSARVSTSPLLPVSSRSPGRPCVISLSRRSSESAPHLPASPARKPRQRAPRRDFLGAIIGPWPVQRDFGSGRPRTSRQSSYPDVPGFHPPATHSSCAGDRWLTQPARSMPARTMIDIPVFHRPLLSRIVVDHLITQSGAADAAKPGAGRCEIWRGWRCDFFAGEFLESQPHPQRSKCALRGSAGNIVKHSLASRMVRSKTPPLVGRAGMNSSARYSESGIRRG
jgi:hypothetical protein